MVQKGKMEMLKQENTAIRVNLSNKQFEEQCDNSCIFHYHKNKQIVKDLACSHCDDGKTKYYAVGGKHGDKSTEVIIEFDLYQGSGDTPCNSCCIDKVLGTKGICSVCGYDTFIRLKR